MTPRITRMISISRDNIMQFGRQSEFYTAVPGMAGLKETFETCHAAYEKSARERGCRCRADNNVLSPCMTAFIDTLNTSKTGDQELMQQFIQFVAKTPNIETTGVTIYYAPPDGTEPKRYVYP